MIKKIAQGLLGLGLVLGVIALGASLPNVSADQTVISSATGGNTNVGDTVFGGSAGGSNTVTIGNPDGCIGLKTTGAGATNLCGGAAANDNTFTFSTFGSSQSIFSSSSRIFLGGSVAGTGIVATNSVPFYLTQGLNSPMVSGQKLNVTEAADTPILRITAPTGAIFGATIFYSVSDDNGTDFIARGGNIVVQGVNKAGTATCALSTGRDTELEDGSSPAVSGGALTLTYTWTIATATTSCDVRLNAASNAGANTYDVTWTVVANGTSGGNMTIVGQ